MAAPAPICEYCGLTPQVPPVACTLNPDRKPNHKFPQAPADAAPAPAAGEELIQLLKRLELRASQTQQQLDAVQADVKELARPQTRPTPSDSELGKQLLQLSLKLAGVGDATGPALLTDAQHAAIAAHFTLDSADGSEAPGSSSVSASSSRGRPIKGPSNPDALENSLVALLTPYLADVCDAVPGAVLANSELIRWIRTASGDEANFQAPDLFLCHRAALLAGERPTLTAKSAASSKLAASFRADSFVFGSCAWQLRDAVMCLLEAKRQVSLNHDVGQVFPKMQNLLHESPERVATQRCCLFDLQQLHLLEFSFTGLVSHQHFAWTAPGSRAALLAFLSGAVRPAWSRVLDALCSQLGVEVLQAGSFLGEGANGRVFAVRQTGTPPPAVPAVLALKLAKTAHDMDKLELESIKLRALVAASEAAAPDTSMAAARPYLPTSASALHRVCVEPGLTGAGLTLSPVGMSVWPEAREQPLLLAVLLALLRLHLAGIVHGDPRMENLVRCPSEGAGAGQLVWIDFRTQLRSGRDAIRSDFVDFVHSFFRARSLPHDEVLAQAGRYIELVGRACSAVEELGPFSAQLWTALGSA